jgi:prepilin-type N-terminal cleavage/methylation domain-containing protein
MLFSTAQAREIPQRMTLAKAMRSGAGNRKNWDNAVPSTLMKTRSNLSRAFTLIELLIVIAVVGILIGSVGLGLRDSDKGNALQAAQSSLSSLVSAARAQAALNGSNASVIIWGDPSDMETYLRRAAVMVETTVGGSTFWVQKGEPMTMPNGIYFVPVDAGAGFPAKFQTASDWNNLDLTEADSNQATSSFDVRRLDKAAGTYASDPTFTASKAYVTVSFNAYGQLVKRTGNSKASHALAVAVGEPDPSNGIVFSNSDSLRGLVLSSYGIPTVVTEKIGFKNN